MLGRIAVRYVVTLLMIVLVGFYPSPTLAQNQGCYGCNVIDDGRLNSGLIGQMVIQRQNGTVIKVIVMDVDPSSGRLRWVDSSSKTGWNEARHYYTPSRSKEQDTGLGWAVIGAVIVGVAAASSQAPGSRAQSKPISPDARRRECENKCYSQAYDPRERSSGQYHCLNQCRRYQ